MKSSNFFGLGLKVLLEGMTVQVGKILMGLVGESRAVVLLGVFGCLRLW